MERELLYKEGQQVWLKANEDEGWPREKVEVYEDVFKDSKTCIVEVVHPKPEHSEDYDEVLTDDIMEITTDQIEGPV